jgi:hypothetical protein
MLTCPTCQNKFHPHMNNSIVGKNARNNTIFVTIKSVLNVGNQ